jgi:hypothetical protein
VLLWPAWLVTALVTVWVYWPGLQGPAMLDDRANLVVLAEIEDDPAYVRDIVLGNHSSMVGRPLSMLSFAVEKQFFDAGLWGIKRTNLMLHLACSLVLALLARTLFMHLELPAATALAALVSAAWCLSPLLVSTVLYAVQRMAQLSTLVVLAGLLVYCQWRVSVIAGRPRLWLLGLLPVCLLFGFLAKENAVLLVPLAVVMECYLFRFTGAGGCLNTRARQATLAGVAIAAGVLLTLAWIRPGLYTGSYDVRDFTMAERVLTEARILWDYLSQLLWPDVRTMGVYHDDYPKSTGLLQPPATLWAVSAWLAVLAAGVAGLFYRRVGLLVFGLLFFLAGHALESTVFALELYFEHRNYLPATGFFIGLGIIAGAALRRLPEATTAGLTVGAVTVLALAPLTASQAAVWSNGLLLHMEAVNAHPRSVRANSEYAGYLARSGFLPQALAAAERAANLEPGLPAGVTASRQLALYCQSNRALPRGFPAEFDVGRNDLDLRSAGDALQVAVELMERGVCPNLDAVALADRFGEIFIDGGAAVPSTQIFLVLALLENTVGRPARGLAYTQRLIERGAVNPQVFLMHLNFAISIGDLDQADPAYEWLRRAEERGGLDRQQRATFRLHLANSTDF